MGYIVSGLVGAFVGGCITVILIALVSANNNTELREEERYE